MKSSQFYRSTVFGLGEIGLVFCLFFHGVNGLRIAYLDMFAPKDWTIEKTRRSAKIALIVALVMWVPAAGWMGLQHAQPQFRPVWRIGGIP